VSAARNLAPRLTAPALAPGGLGAAREKMLALATSTGIPRVVLERLAVAPSTAPADAIKAVREAVGEDAWQRAAALDGLPRATMLLQALNARGREARRPALAPRASLATYHDAHAEDPRAYRAEPEERRAAAPVHDPEREAMISRLMSRGTTATREQIGASYDAMSKQMRATAGEAPRLASVPSPRQQRRARALSLGLDPERYEASHRALFPGVS
jgi:hypothetical protein